MAENDKYQKQLNQVKNQQMYEAKEKIGKNN